MVLVFLNDAHGLFHFAFVVEIHFEMDTIATDVVEQRFQFIEGYPAGHDALTTLKDLAVEVIPFR